jgi:predicted MFS family arabinose efflux permease
MHDWSALFRTPVFRRFWLALLCNNMASWCVTAALPVLIAQRFGAGMALVISLGLRVIPKVLLAPLAGGLLQRFGPARIASLAMLGQAALTVSLPWAPTLGAMQLVIAAIGTLDLFVMPGLLSLRGVVTPNGREMAGNTLYSVADRSAKIIGPALGGLVIGFGVTQAFLVFGCLTAAASLAVARLRRLTAPSHAVAERQGSVGAFFGILRDRQMLGLFIVALTYMVMLGGLRPFLFWANRDWFGASDTAWTGLLAAQGFGALIGALVSGSFATRLMKSVDAYTVTLLAGLAEGVLHLTLLGAGSAPVAMVLLALAGIPEILSTASWFTAAQTRLTPQQQAILFTFSAPIWDLAYAIGTFSGGLHAQGGLSLSGYWALVSLSSSLPLVPLLVMRRARAAA